MSVNDTSEDHHMRICARITLAGASLLVLLSINAAPAAAQKKPNIVFIMGDDIGWFNIGAYHRGMMAGKTPT
jgi:arylsulfatase